MRREWIHAAVVVFRKIGIDLGVARRPEDGREAVAVRYLVLVHEHEAGDDSASGEEEGQPVSQPQF